MCQRRTACNRTRNFYIHTNNDATPSHLSLLGCLGASFDIISLRFFICMYNKHYYMQGTTWTVAVSNIRPDNLQQLTIKLRECKPLHKMFLSLRNWATLVESSYNYQMVSFTYKAPAQEHVCRYNGSQSSEINGVIPLSGNRIVRKGISLLDDAGSLLSMKTKCDILFQSVIVRRIICAIS